MISVTVDGQRISLPGHMNLAAALLGTGRMIFHHTANGSPRGPYCMIGQCFECIMTINGRAQTQACMVRVEADMVIETRRGLPHIRENLQ
ncbi:MAG: (2Fe-2S)-binding protein [Pseudomonadota bacterium]